MLESYVVGKYLSQKQISLQPRCPATTPHPPRNYTLITLSITAITHLHPHQLALCLLEVVVIKLYLIYMVSIS